MIAITFLGATSAQETAYRFPDGSEETASFFGIALARHYPNLKMLVFVTSGAREAHLATFLAAVTQSVESITEVDIPDGKDERELWAIFEKVVANVADKEEVIFDITHGYRSLPFLSFLAAAYLRKVKQVELIDVLYGNYEGRDKTMTPNRTPVISLKQFVTLLDWMIAADFFSSYGDARDLSDLLIGTKPAKDAPLDERKRWNQSGINSLASQLSELSTSLSLIRPAEVLAVSAKLQVFLPQFMEQAGELAKPLRPLGERIAETYSTISAAKEMQSVDPVHFLETERELVFWYLERNQLVQAMALAREWLISYTALRCLGPSTHLLDKMIRERVERQLGYQGALHRHAGTKPPKEPLDLGQITNSTALVDVFGSLGDLRNDLLHAGKRKQPAPGKSLLVTIRTSCERLREFTFNQ